MITVIISQAVIFVILLFGLRHFMKGHVSGAVGHLTKVNDELMKQQAALKAKIADAEQEHQHKMTKLDEEISAKQEQIRKEANESLENSRKAAMSEREKLINEAVQTRDQMRQEVMSQMEAKAIGHSVNMVAEFLSNDLGTLVHEKLVEDVITGIAGVDMESFQIQTQTAQLIVAAKLDPKQRDEIQKVLEKKIGKKIELEEELDTKLVAGLVLKFGTLIVDGSLTNRLEKAASEMKKKSAAHYQKVK